MSTRDEVQRIGLHRRRITKRRAKAHRHGEFAKKIRGTTPLADTLERVDFLACLFCSHKT